MLKHMNELEIVDIWIIEPGNSNERHSYLVPYYSGWINLIIEQGFPNLTFGASFAQMIHAVIDFWILSNTLDIY